MCGKELIEKTIKGFPTQRIPKGEIEIDEGFLQKILNQEHDKNSRRIRKREILKTLEADLVTVDLSGFLQEIDATSQLKEIEEWVKEKEYFVFAMIGGVFSSLCQKLGFETYCTSLKSDSSGLRKEIMNFLKGQTILAKDALGLGVDGLIIADDVAYQRGCFLSPLEMEQWVFPYLKTELELLKTTGKPIFFHSCGNINSIIERLVALGFDGLQGLQPSAGMEIIKLKEKYGNRITLMGNFEPDYWDLQKEEEIKRQVKDTLSFCMEGGRFIAGTSGGLSAASDPEYIKKLYGWLNNWSDGKLIF